MKNITVTVDDHIHHNARMFAARWDTSVSALVAEFLYNMPIFWRLMRDAKIADTAKEIELANAKLKTASTSQIGTSV